MTRSKKVVIVYRYVPYYRLEFYELLRTLLQERGIVLELVYGDPGTLDALKKDAVEVPWGIKIKNRIWKIGKQDFFWQPVFSYLVGADLVIVESASRLLINYILLIRYKLGIQKYAFWGHGRNFQDVSASRTGEWIKRLLINQVYWWFAYNDLSARVLQRSKVPPEKITSVQNAIDTRDLTKALATYTPQRLDAFRAELGIKSRNVAIFVGGFYFEKRIPFLLEALELVRREVPDFEMIFIGSGSDVGLIQDAVAAHKWIHFIGPKFNIEKVPYFAISKLFLLPGAVGLGILDAFAFETPLVTTNISFHGPEIDYLENGVNGVMVMECENPQSYATTVINLLEDESARQRLVQACRVAREKYTVEAMAERFAKGIEQALESV
jgi:glycosyltransferase involved in cell wall biosynthesis